MSERPIEDRQFDEMVDRIYNDPRFKDVVRKKQRFSLWLLLFSLGLYILLILFVGFAPDLVGKPITPQMVTTWGIPAGFFLIIWTIGLTAFYVHKTNTVYDPMTADLLKEIANGKEK